MGHNLNVVAGKVAFASTENAWHGLGKIVDKPMNTLEAIEFGGLDYVVEKRKLFCDGQQVDGSFATKRMDTNQILGVVGEQYEVVQNSDVFNFFDEVIDKGSAKIETVGALGQGEKIFVSAKLPHRLCVGKDDLTEMYMLLTSSHNGQGAIVAGLTPVRVVCQNTLNHALSKKMKNRISIRHTATASKRIEQAGKIMRHALEFQIGLEESYNFLYKTKVSDKMVKELLTGLASTIRTTEKGVSDFVEKLETCYNTGAGHELAMGTLWGVYNGVTNYLSHEKNYGSPESKFSSLLLGGESEIFAKKSFDTLMSFAKTN